MANKMLIDSSHPEETRVVVTRGHKVEEFDFESANRRQLRGNIYLAKVTRVEPSLQAAFVEYGGNRHGFLAFSEIHPDYYQIPVADRQALLEADARAEQDAEPEEERGGRGRRRRRGSARRNRSGGETVSAPMDAENGAEESFAAPDEFDSEGETAERHETHSAEGEPELPIALPNLGVESEPQAGSEAEQAGGDATVAPEVHADEHASSQAEQSLVSAEAAPARDAWAPILPEEQGEPAQSDHHETEAFDSEEPNGRPPETREVTPPDEDEEDD
jgi:ribonuclease E